ncbi:MAG: hypothetical protein MUF12_02710 [Sediminibacterium sp.]|nr:hypothetical protein [Sediminibacterium sp.]
MHAGNSVAMLDDTEANMIFERRSGNSIYTRFSKQIAPKVSKYLGVEKSVKEESGWDKHRYYMAVKKMYEDRNPTLGNPDEFIACVEYLRDKPKWHAYMAANNEEETLKRPFGQKKEKSLMKDKNIVKETIKELKIPLLMEGTSVDDAPSDVTTNITSTYDLSNSRSKMYLQAGECMVAYTKHLKEQQEHRVMMSLPTPERATIKKLNYEIMCEKLALKKARVIAKRRRFEANEDIFDKENEDSDDDDSVN